MNHLVQESSQLPCLTVQLRWLQIEDEHQSYSIGNGTKQQGSTSSYTKMYQVMCYFLSGTYLSHPNGYQQPHNCTKPQQKKLGEEKKLKGKKIIK